MSYLGIREEAPTEIRSAIEAFREGRFVILVDDENREDEGDLLLAAEHVTPEALNFMIQEARGMVTLATVEERLKELEIPLLPPAYAGDLAPRFAVPIDLKHGTTTGISVMDRAKTMRHFISSTAKASDFARPGHVFPLAAAPGSLAERRGHTEGAVELARLAGLCPAVVMIEMLDDTGASAKKAYILDFAQAHGFAVVEMRQIVQAVTEAVGVRG